MDQQLMVHPDCEGRTLQEELEVLQDLPDVSQVFFVESGKDQNVIYITDAEVQVPQDAVHQSMEGCPHIPQSQGGEGEDIGPEGFSRQNAAHIVTQLKHLLMFCLCGVFCGYLGILIGRLLTEGLYGKPYRVHLPVQENFSSYPAFKEGPTPTRRLAAKPVEERGYRILVMSSVGRSGSSFLGQLVAQLPNTVYVFEPLHFLQKQNAQGVTSDNSRELLSAIYECRFAGEWVQFSLGRKATLTHLELEKECARDRDTYLDCVTKFCLSRMNKVIKFLTSFSLENERSALAEVAVVTGIVKNNSIAVQTSGKLAGIE
ncbi:uncharacterized protein [Macrobrachium rosenbergii]|uniref:uncharacterized protein n=1 Tax=Macrobrachium rosenbergii TaxID=79674 RepID=UPI0034D5805A